MRVVKSAEERKNEILDRALELFSAKGYENTSVSDIMQAVGIAKGTLYYHFISKEEILDGILQRIYDATIERAKGVAENEQLSVHEKLLQTLLSLQITDTQGTEMLYEVHKPQNALMHQKMLRTMIRDVTPILSEVVEEGVRQGIFHTEYPYESAEMFVTYGNVVFDGAFADISKENLPHKIAAFVTNMERVLGAGEGNMQYVLQMFITEDHDETDER